MSKMYSCSGSTKFSSYPQNSQPSDGANSHQQSKRDLSSTTFKSASVDISASNTLNNINNNVNSNNTNQQHKFLSSLVQDYLVNPVLSHLTNTATLLNDQVKVVSSSVDPTVGASPGSYPPSSAESDFRLYEQLYRMSKNIFGVAGLSFDCAHHQAPSGGGRRNSSGFVGSLSEESKQLISDLCANASVAAAQAASSNLCATTSTDAHNSNNFLSKVMMFLMPSIPFGSPSKDSGSISTQSSPKATRKGAMDSNKISLSVNSSADIPEFPSLKLKKSFSEISKLNKEPQVCEGYRHFLEKLRSGFIPTLKFGECKRTRSMSDVGSANNEVINFTNQNYQMPFGQDFWLEPHNGANTTTTTVNSCDDESSQNQSEEEGSSEQSYSLVQHETQRPAAAKKKKIVEKLATASTTTGGCSNFDLLQFLFYDGTFNSNTTSSPITTKTTVTVPKLAKDFVQHELKEDNVTNGQTNGPVIGEVLQQHRQLKQERRRKNRRRRHRKSKNKSSSDTESSKSSDTGSVHDESCDELPHMSNNTPKCASGSRRSKRMKGPCMAFNNEDDDDLVEFDNTKELKKGSKSPKSPKLPKSPKSPKGAALFGHHDEDDEDADEEEEEDDDSYFSDEDDDYDHMDGVDMSIFGGGLIIGSIFGNSCSSGSASTSVASNSPICDNNSTRTTTTTPSRLTTSVCAGIPSTVRALFNGGLCPFSSRNSTAAFTPSSSSSVPTTAQTVNGNCSDAVDIPSLAFSPSTLVQEDDLHMSPLFSGSMSPDLSPMPLTEEDIQRNRQMMEEEEKNRILVEEANKRWDEAMLYEPKFEQAQLDDHPERDLQQGEVFHLEDVDQPDNQSSLSVKKSASSDMIPKSQSGRRVRFSEQPPVKYSIDETEEEQELSKQSRQKYWEYLAMDRLRHEAEISAILKPEHRERIFQERFSNPESQQ